MERTLALRGTFRYDPSSPLSRLAVLVGRCGRHCTGVVLVSTGPRDVSSGTLGVRDVQPHALEFKLAFALQLKRLEQVPLLYAEVIWPFHRTLNAVYLRRGFYPRRTAVKIPTSTAYKSEKGDLVMTPRTTLALFLRRMRP